MLSYSLNLLRIILLCSLVTPALAAEQSVFKDISTGEPRTLESYTGNGKWTVVMIWASDCHVCNHEVHNYVDFQFIHSDRDARVVGISIDGWAGKQDARDFIERHNVNFPNLIGNADAVADWFRQLTGTGFRGTPTFLIYDPDGQIKAQTPGAVPVNLIEDFIGKNGVSKADG